MTSKVTKQGKSSLNKQGNSVAEAVVSLRRFELNKPISEDQLRLAAKKIDSAIEELEKAKFVSQEVLKLEFSI